MHRSNLRCLAQSARCASKQRLPQVLCQSCTASSVLIPEEQASKSGSGCQPDEISRELNSNDVLTASSPPRRCKTHARTCTLHKYCYGHLLSAKSLQIKSADHSQARFCIEATLEHYLNSYNIIPSGLVAGSCADRQPEARHERLKNRIVEYSAFHEMKHTIMQLDA